MSIVVECKGQIMQIRLSRPEKRNAIDHDMAIGLDRALRDLETSPQARVGVLLADGPVFCAGTDMSDPRDKRTVEGGEYGLLRRERSKPLVAVVDGPALGGGFELVLACDLVVASSRAEFGFPETRRGVVATGGGLFRTLGTLPYHVAAELLLTGRRLDAARALALGLTSAVVEPTELDQTVCDLADDILQGGPAATAETLVALRAFARRDDQFGWWATGRAKSAVLASRDATEGRAAFLEGRVPDWSPPQV